MKTKITDDIYLVEIEDILVVGYDSKEAALSALSGNEVQKRIMDLMNTHFMDKTVFPVDLINHLPFCDSTIRTHMRNLADKGLLVRLGERKGYKLA